MQMQEQVQVVQRGKRGGEGRGGMDEVGKVWEG